jgi:hypothetical protein
MASHQGHAVFQLFVHANRERVIRHDFCHASAPGIATFGDYSLHQIALGKDPNQLAIVHHGHRADVALDHNLDSFEDSMAQFGLIGVLILDEVADTHWYLQGIEDCELSKASTGARVYAQKEM